MIRTIDAHNHLADPRFDSVREDVMGRALERGVVAAIQGGVGPEDWDKQLELVKAWPGRVFPCFGLHPWWVAAHSEQEAKQALALLPGYLEGGNSAAPAVGLGELGLDFGVKISSEFHPLQEYIFEAQLKLARLMNLPLVLHVVRAHDRALEILKQTGVPVRGGIVHSFSETPSVARRYLEMGLVPSISGAVIARGSGKAFEKLRQSVVSLGLDQMVVETDAPDQGIGPEFLELNEPANLWEVARRVAALKGESAEAVLTRSKRTLIRIFSLPEI